MNDILAVVLVCLLSDTLLRELPAHFEADFDYEAHLKSMKEPQQKPQTGPSPTKLSSKN